MNHDLDKRFENVTMNGRLCYIFMCIERYLLALYPERDWTIIAKKMWQWPAANCWQDEVWYEYYSILPDMVMGWKHWNYKTVEDFLNDPFNRITHEEYEQAVALYTGITDGNPDDEFCIVLSIPHELCNICDAEYYSDKVCDEQTLGSIKAIENILNKHDIPLPDASLVAEYTLENVDVTKQWWYRPDIDIDYWKDSLVMGFATKGTEKLSIILNKI